MRAVALTDEVESADGLDLAMDARRKVARTEAVQFDAILSYLDQAGAEPLARAGGVNEWTRYGGSGTPSVSEYVVAEVGPALGLSTTGGRKLIADALDLAYRLPKLFACLHDGTVDAWRIRLVARTTREFTIAQAAEADRRLSAANVDGEPLLARLPMWRIRKILAQIRIVETPEDAEDERDGNRNRRDVRIWPSGTGVASINGTLSVEDAQRLDQRLDHIVESLRFLGDERPYGVLRSVALGMLDEPDSLDDLYAKVRAARAGDEAAEPHAEEPEPETEPAGHETTGHETTGNETSDERAASPRADKPVPEAFTRTTRHGRPKTVLYMHFDRTWGTYSLDGVGAITRSEAVEIIGHSDVTIRPVIDLETTITATGYVASPRLKEQTALMNGGTCTFPHCDKPARVCDFDHIINHREGGPTDTRNGHRLCRFHHRAKTFTGWTVSSPAPGIWIWTSPNGRTYLVTGGTTTKLPGRVNSATNHRRKHHAA